MPYCGPNRRVHAVFVTRHREYHVRAGVCVAVRDLGTLTWISNHAAMGLCLEQEPEGTRLVGRPLVMWGADRKIETSNVTDIFRPNRNVVQMYGIVKALRHD
ncbi:MAG: hypothetical protein PHU25_00750 [Deltaproteobacteria bacterium]|nr:hypothetical protein [Deltaproteobacteria bacterium]